MRVVLVLGTEALTTKQMHRLLPDVAQASLYRAVSRLVDAGIIAVVERHRRGGALESVYRVADVDEFSATASTAEEFVAAAGSLGRSLSVDAARHASAGDWSPGSASLFHESANLSPEQFGLFTRQVAELLRQMATATPPDVGKEFSVTVVAIPRRASEDDRAPTG